MAYLRYTPEQADRCLVYDLVEAIAKAKDWDIEAREIVWKAAGGKGEVYPKPKPDVTEAKVKTAIAGHNKKMAVKEVVIPNGRCA